MNAGRTRNRNLFTFSPVIATLLLFLLVNGYTGTTIAATGKKSCVTAKCHANMGTAKYVHGPVALKECTFCHKPTAAHAFEAIKNVGKLCNDCHDKTFSGKVVHAPVQKGNCTGCHDPHQSPYQFQLRAEGANLCLICHDKKLTENKYTHGPVAVGGCSICHSPHASEFPKLLMAAGNDVCFSCHADKADAFKEKKHIHAPVEDECVQCHSPHGGAFQYNLPADGRRELCLTCHDDMEKLIGEVSVKHKGLDTERKCLACHDPHVSDYAKQLIKQPADLCLSCHDKEYRAGGKVKVADMKAMLGQNKVHHGPIKEKDCSSCHSPHGSNNFRILREYFPEVFYSPYRAGYYKLCFTCHEKTIAEEKFTTTMTGFRNGNENLHFVHVNQAVKGRTCRACHDAHATNNPKHIRDGVPFGAWELPINFKKNANGGTCLPGCHQLFEYDRGKPVDNRK